MADARLFAKLDLGYFDNPKVADFIEDHPHALFLHLRAILYCRQHLTDGHFPVRLVCRMASASYCGSECEQECDYCRAVGAGLIERLDPRTGNVHDYLEHQDSAEDVQRRSKAGKKGAAARWSDPDADRNAKRNAKGNATTNAEERRGEESNRGASQAKRRAPEHPLPDTWRPTSSHQNYAEENNLDLSTEVFRFRNHAKANDRRQRDWDAAFRMWLSKAQDYAPPKRKVVRSDVPEAWQ